MVQAMLLPVIAMGAFAGSSAGVPSEHGKSGHGSDGSGWYVTRERLYVHIPLIERRIEVGVRCWGHAQGPADTLGGLPVVRMPRWSSHATPPSTELASKSAEVVGDGIGFPFVAFYGELTYAHVDAAQSIGGPDSRLLVDRAGAMPAVPVRVGGMWWPPRESPMVPYGIVPLGFAANVAIYAAGLWLLLLGARWMRLLLMRGRIPPGHCAVCRYPVEGMTRCPECGSITSRGEGIAAPPEERIS